MGPVPRPVPPPADAAPREELVARLRAAGCVFAEDEAALLSSAARSPGELRQLVDARVAGQPLEYLLGWVDFAGLRIAVGPGVFVPRQRTELLVERALPLVGDGGTVVELCCGAAAVSAALLAARPGLRLYAADIDEVAVRCAAANLGGRGRVYRGDLYAPLPGELRGAVDVLVVNAPYVPSEAIATMPPEARLHEPLTALDGGADGLDLHRRIAAGAGEWLAPGGHLVIETSRGQASRTAGLAEAAGLRAQVVRDEQRDATAVVAVLPR